MRQLIALVVFSAALFAQPLAKPLAELDKMVDKVKSGSLISDPVRAGQTTVIPFASMQFTLGTVGAPIALGGGMGGSVVPMGVIIVEGDDVRIEAVAEQSPKLSMLQELMKAIIDRKIVFMGNGINLGNAPGKVDDLAPAIKSMMGETTWVGNALNLGHLNAGQSKAEKPKVRK